jgi:endoglucanase
LKLNFPLASTVALLAWGIADFRSGYEASKELPHALENLRVASTYLMDCHIAPRRYIGQIGHPDIDHSFWGRAEQQSGSRPAYVYDESKNASDLLGKVAAALAASSVVWRDVNATFAGQLLSHARQLWQWGDEKPGKYSEHYASATASIYKSSAFEDDMAYGAAWLYRATGERRYLDAAVRYWRSKSWTVVTDWDGSGAATAVILANMVEDGVDVPRGEEINSWVKNVFLRAWTTSNGKQLTYATLNCVWRCFPACSI